MTEAYKVQNFQVGQMPADLKGKLSPHLDSIKKGIMQLPEFSSQSGFEDFLVKFRTVIATIPEISMVADIFQDAMLQRDRHIPLIEKTPWGLVYLRNVDAENKGKDAIKKWLVVQKGGTLGFEYHKIKHEHLQVLEGCSMIVYRPTDKPAGYLEILWAFPGDEVEFPVGYEHGLVAVNDSVILETSSNHLDAEDILFKYTVSPSSN